MKIVTTMRELRAAFDADDTLDDWTLCVDSGEFYLRYIGPDDEPPEPPIAIKFEGRFGDLIEELCDLAGIPAEQA